MDRKPFRILAVAGSLRQGSYNRGLLRAAQELAPQWVEVQYFDIGQLPFFNEDVEAAGDPEPVRRFKEAPAASNAVLIATPKYNGAVPGVLANAIDWASRPTGRSVLRNKPVAVMGAVLGPSGSANAQATLRGVLGRIGAIVVPDPQVLVPRVSRLFDEQVDVRDEGTREEIRLRIPPSLPNEMRFHCNSEKSVHETLEHSGVIPHLSSFTPKTGRAPIRALPLVQRGRWCAVVDLPVCLRALV
jgi:chromate reductase